MMGFQLMVGNFNIVASVTRLVWRFAADKGLPFHRHFTYASTSGVTRCSTNRYEGPSDTPGTSACSFPGRLHLLSPVADQPRFSGCFQLAHLSAHYRAICVIPRSDHASHDSPAFWPASEVRTLSTGTMERPGQALRHGLLGVRHHLRFFPSIQADYECDYELRASNPCWLLPGCHAGLVCQRSQIVQGAYSRTRARG